MATRVRDWLALMILYDAPDGRRIFRPWGARGPTYLVSDHARDRLVRFVGICWGLMFVALLVIGQFPLVWWRFALAAVATLSLMYGGFWVISRTLPQTEPPPRPAQAQVKAVLDRQNQLLGAPLLWILELASLVFLATGVWMLAEERSLAALLVVAFGGWCSFDFGRRILSLRQRSAPPN